MKNLSAQRGGTSSGGRDTQGEATRQKGEKEEE